MKEKDAAWMSINDPGPCQEAEACTDHLAHTFMGLKAAASVTGTGNPRENSSLLFELRTLEQIGENCQLLLRVDVTRCLLGLLFGERERREGSTHGR